MANHPAANGQVAKRYRTRGQERLEYKSGGSVHARSLRQSSRGLTIDHLITDDPEPLLDPQTLEDSLPCFGNRRPRIVIVG